MDIIAAIAEEKIKRAIERGELKNLRGAGKPFEFEDDTWVPNELRLAYKMLKNAGCIPPELELRKEISSLRELIETMDDDKEKTRMLRRLNFLIMKLETELERSSRFRALPRYEEKLYRRFLG